MLSILVLDYLAVHPENQGKGVASALVKIGLEKMANTGLDIFVLAFERGYGVYKRLGFRIERELIQDDSPYGGPGKYTLRYMIYEQNSRGTKSEPDV